MKIRLLPAALLPAAGLLLLSGCSSVKVWPFDESQPANRSSAPANATEYQCNAGKRFYVRYLDNGTSAWLIYLSREVRLTKDASASGTRYTNGVAVLTISDGAATLTDGPAISYGGCKAASK